MSDDINVKRDFVSSMYSGSPGWKRKVANMSDRQVTAIYLKEKAKKDSKPKKENQDDIPF